MTKKLEDDQNEDFVPAFDPELLAESTRQAKQEYGRFNLAIVGETGVGKSSLVNAVFGRKMAEVGHGLPVTRGVDYHHDENLGIYDFEGFEIDSETRSREFIGEQLRMIQKGPENQRIHIVWYCVNSLKARFAQGEIDIVKDFDAAGIPVILVLTKVQWQRNPLTQKWEVPDSVQQYAEWARSPEDNEGNPIEIPFRNVMLTSTVATKGEGVGRGLAELVEETLSVLPEDRRDTFRVVQRINLPWKRKLARKVIFAAATTAAASASIPIPVADAAALAPIQLGMMGKIATIFGLDLKIMVSASMLAQIGTQITGRALARSFLKAIPGAGSVINASVAAALTAATGEGWHKLCERVYTNNLDISQIEESWGDYAPTVVQVVKKWAFSR